MEARAWTRAERPSQLFDQVVAWLRTQKVLLPGVSTVARLVSEVRADTSERLYSRLSGRVSSELGQRLTSCWRYRPALGCLSWTGCAALPPGRRGWR